MKLAVMIGRFLVLLLAAMMVGTIVRGLIPNPVIGVPVSFFLSVLLGFLCADWVLPEE